jgi:hypothetical protein
MPAFVAGIHVFTALRVFEGVDARHKAGHDERIFEMLFLLCRQEIARKIGECRAG